MTRGETEPKIHFLGAACSGATSLGLRAAQAFGLPHVDTDDFFWQPTDPPYTRKRPVSDRLVRMRAAMGTGGWVVSGALDGWGDDLIRDVDLIVFLTAPTALRLARLKAREKRRFGDRIGPGGDMERLHASFLVWASQYDDAGFAGRSRMRHETWLESQPAPVLRLESTRSVEEMLEKVLIAVHSLPAPMAMRAAT